MRVVLADVQPLPANAAEADPAGVDSGQPPSPSGSLLDAVFRLVFPDWSPVEWRRPYCAVVWAPLLSPGCSSISDVTPILSQIESGDSAAAEQLLPLVYGELRKLAVSRLAQEKPGLTLQATALVHEAYVQLVDAEKVRLWNSRGHLFAAAAEAMRRILVDQARRKQTQRRGGDGVRIDLDVNNVTLDAEVAESERILAVHEALTALEAESPRETQLVKLRFFAGMTLEEAATVLGVSVATAKRDWASARVWLYRWMSSS